MVEPVVVELETEFTCTTNGSFPDPESCHKYYVCNIMPDGELKGFVFDCPPGLSFHAENGRCDWPASEDCKHQVSVVACSSLEGEARTLCQERINLEVSPVVIELETDLECSESGIFADPYSCDKYYSCTVIDGLLCAGAGGGVCVHWARAVRGAACSLPEQCMETHRPLLIASYHHNTLSCYKIIYIYCQN